MNSLVFAADGFFTILRLRRMESMSQWTFGSANWSGGGRQSVAVVRRQVAQIGLDRVQRSVESGDQRFDRRHAVAGGEGAFKLVGGCGKLKRSNRSGRSINLMSEIASGGGIGLGERMHVRDEFGRLHDKEIQKVMLQSEIAVGLNGKMEAVERLTVVAKIAHFISRNV
jgi:hypothetical protein